MSKIIIEINEEFKPWLLEVRERILVGMKCSIHSHEGLPNGFYRVISDFCDGKIFSISQKHVHCTLAHEFGMAPTALNKGLVTIDKAGFCADLALSAFEMALDFHARDSLSGMSGVY